MLGVDEDDGVSARVATVSSESSRWLTLPIALAVSEKSRIEDRIQEMASRQQGW
jgi:hypothetical protein